MSVSLFVASEKAVDDGIALGPIATFSHLLAVIFQQSNHRGLVQLRIIVLEERLHSSANLSGLGAVGILRHGVEHVGNAIEFDAAYKGLAEEAHRIDIVAPFPISILQPCKHPAETV